MATQDIHAPTLGAQGEPCASCGAPLAADQRYCLECGTRRAEARLAFRDILTGQAPPPGAAPPGAPAPADPPPARAGLAFLAGLLCLLVALGVGVLIGRSGDDTPTAATTPPPQVITVNGSAPASTTPAAGSGDSSGATSTDSSSSSSSSKSTKSDSGSSGASSSKSSKSSNKSVKDLDSSSGSDYQKKSEKLPKEVGTGGKAPPKDNKPAGGGSDFEDIG